MATNMRIGLVGIALVAALGAAACGGEDTAAGEPVFEPEPAQTEPTQIEPTQTTDLRSTLDAIVMDTGVPGLGAAAFDSNGMVDVATAGLRRVDKTDPVVDGDPFHLGSNTKAMTAALLGLLDQQGTLSFDTTLPDAFADRIPIDPAFADVTLGDLLTHTGGTPARLPDLGDHSSELSIVNQRAAATELTIGVGSEPAVAPGTVSRYSNAGYVIVGSAMEFATGVQWEELITKELFEPLGMTSCGFGAPGDGSGETAPVGHTPDGSPFNADNEPFTGPAGTVHCQMSDWGLFLSELLLAGQGEGVLFDQATVERLFAAADEPVENIDGAKAAMGWVRFDGGPNGPVFMHDGSNTFWYSQAVVVPGLDIAVVGVANHEAKGMEAVSTAIESLSHMYPGTPAEESSNG